ANGSMATLATAAGNQRDVIDGATRWIFTAFSLLAESNDADKVLRAGGRYLSCVMSSSRVHSSFTGLFAAFAHSTAAGMKSPSSRRPKPPPRNVVCTNTFSG